MNAQSLSSSTEARQLVERLSSRLENEKRELVLFLIELAELDTKKLALELGYPSTLGCLVNELKLTESSACRRIAAARLLARFPQIGRYLLANRLTLMGLVALKDVLDESNADELLERAAGLSEPDVRQLVMRLRLEAAAPSPSLDVAPSQLGLASRPAATVAADAVATPTGKSSAEPREELQAVTLWVGSEFREELEAVRALLGHAVPGGKREEVLLHVLRAQRKMLERRRHGSPKRSNKSTAPADSTEHIPAALFCRAHNLLQARKDFGDEHVKRKQLEESVASALVRLGYKRGEAEKVIGVAVQELPRGSDLRALVQKSLQILAR